MQSNALAAGGAAESSASVADDSAAMSEPHLGAIDTEAALVERLRAEPTSVRSAAATKGGSTGTTPPATQAQRYVASPCEASVRRSTSAALGDLDYVATLVWNGSDAEVLVFAPTGGAAERDAVVTARADCRELAHQRF
jgi:hypothetical protein